ncbi:MAG: helix-turn-helix domain-containing protein [Cyanobacteria bacterium J06638_22]
MRLNHRGWTTEQIAEYLGCQVATVRQTIHRWRDEGLGGLWDSPREGRPRRWEEEDMAYVAITIEESPTTVNSRQLVNQLEQAREVTLSRRHLRRVLKKRAIAGNVPGTAIRASKTRLSEPLSKQN